MEASITRRSKKLSWIYFRLGVFILVPLALLILPGNQFDDGPPLCLSVLLFKQECYACGMTRAAQHLIHLQLEDAWYYNPLIFVVFPILAFQWARWFWNDWKKLQILRASGPAT